MDSPSEGSRVTLRRAAGSDADTASEIYLCARHAAVLTIPPVAHEDDEVRRWFREVVVTDRETWLAEQDDRPMAVMVLDGDELDQLYVHPDWTNRGVGSALLRLAQHQRPSGLTLCDFSVKPRCAALLRAARLRRRQPHRRQRQRRAGTRHPIRVATWRHTPRVDAVTFRCRIAICDGVRRRLGRLLGARRGASFAGADLSGAPPLRDPCARFASPSGPDRCGQAGLGGLGSSRGTGWGHCWARRVCLVRRGGLTPTTRAPQRRADGGGPPRCRPPTRRCPRPRR